MTITSSINTFSNSGNIPTLHQPTTTVTHTHWLPTVADPHHLPQVWLLALLILIDLGVKTVNTRENVSLGMYICIYMHISG